MVLRYSVKGGAESRVVQRYTSSELSGSLSRRACSRCQPDV